MKEKGVKEKEKVNGSKEDKWKKIRKKRMRERKKERKKERIRTKRKKDNGEI